MHTPEGITADLWKLPSGHFQGYGATADAGPWVTVANAAALLDAKDAEIARLTKKIDTYRLLTAGQNEQLTRLRKDAERLDFMQDHPELRLNCRKGRWSLMGLTSYEYDTHATLREAVDAAIATNPR